MNLLALLTEAARRIGVAHKLQPGVKNATPVKTLTPDPDLADRIEHGLGRPMNRRELFKFTAIAAAVGTPVVRELILKPAKTIVVPPAPSAAWMEDVLAEYPGDLGIGNAPSISETIAAQYEVMRPRLEEHFNSSRVIERLMSQIEPHLDDIIHGSDPWGALGYEPNEPFRRLVRRGETVPQAERRLQREFRETYFPAGRSIRTDLQLDPNTPDSERMVGGLYVPDGVELRQPGSFAAYEREHERIVAEADGGLLDSLYELDDLIDDYEDDEEV